MIASLVLVLYFTGLISIETAIACLYISGILLLIAEFGILSLGLLAVNALISLYAGFALQTGHTMFMGVDVGWALVFGIAVAEFIILIGGIYIWRKHAALRIQTGTDAMIGQRAVVVEWTGRAGKISYEGEVWKAASAKELDLRPQETVTIQGIDKLTLMINP